MTWLSWLLYTALAPKLVPVRYSARISSRRELQLRDKEQTEHTMQSVLAESDAPEMCCMYRIRRYSESCVVWFTGLMEK